MFRTPHLSRFSPLLLVFDFFRNNLDKGILFVSNAYVVDTDALEIYWKLAYLRKNSSNDHLAFFYGRCYAAIAIYKM